MTVCNRCGKENQDHYKFCLGCGAELTAPKAPAAGGGNDMGMMKTMMADQGNGPSAPLGAPPGGRGPGPAQASGGMRPGGMPGMPPSGPLGGSRMAPPNMAPPMGPPPGVPAYGGFPPAG